jgi:hypothetical protein
MSTKNCKACDHFCDSGQAIGTCRRYPLFQTRSPNEWCGEFTPVPYAEPIHEMLALPVHEMSTMAQVNAAFDNAYEEHAKTKRKYTKKVKA